MKNFKKPTVTAVNLTEADIICASLCMSDIGCPTFSDCPTNGGTIPLGDDPIE